eukprot:g1912.t1
MQKQCFFEEMFEKELTQEDVFTCIARLGRSTTNAPYNPRQFLRSLDLSRQAISSLSPNCFSALSFLTSLDLSRNLLERVNGLDKGLPKLTYLSLYHNKINNLDEVKRLFALSSLRCLDLRLNPVVRSSGGGLKYRKKIQLLLPQLNKLDGRILERIKDGEHRGESAMKRLQTLRRDYENSEAFDISVSESEEDSSIGDDTILMSSISENSDKLDHSNEHSNVEAGENIKIIHDLADENERLRAKLKERERELEICTKRWKLSFQLLQREFDACRAEGIKTDIALTDSGIDVTALKEASYRWKKDFKNTSTKSRILPNSRKNESVPPPIDFALRRAGADMWMYKPPSPIHYKPKKVS